MNHDPARLAVVARLAEGEAIDLLRSAERLLAEAGAAVALCPVYGSGRRAAERAS